VRGFRRNLKEENVFIKLLEYLRDDRYSLPHITTLPSDLTSTLPHITTLPSDLTSTLPHITTLSSDLTSTLTLSINNTPMKKRPVVRRTVNFTLWLLLLVFSSLSKPHRGLLSTCILLLLFNPKRASLQSVG